MNAAPPPALRGLALTISCAPGTAAVTRRILLVGHHIGGQPVPRGERLAQRHGGAKPWPPRPRAVTRSSALPAVRVPARPAMIPAGAPLELTCTE
ncbi:hypothetical protein ACFWY6_33220 [Streptomyces sp. NPDC059037]|uniref:hypothetical protein n=1 Tax=Streptomyces sp. NPDC059037 TaxID=3346710 RepID=UPI003683DC4B